MRLAKEILLDFIAIRGDINKLVQELEELGAISEELGMRVTACDIVRILKRYLARRYNNDFLVLWGERLEAREYVECDTDEIQEVIFELANPSIFGVMTYTRAQAIVSEMQRSMLDCFNSVV